MICALLLFVLKYKAANSRVLIYKFLQAFIGPDQKREDKLQKKNETKKKERKTEKRKKLNYKEGRGKKPKIQACLNSQEIRKVNKVKKTNKQNKQKQVKKKLYV